MRNSLLLAAIPVLCAINLGCATAALASDAALRDPTQPSGGSYNPATRATTSGKLNLTLIRLGAEPVAVINGNTIAPGESIAGYRLLSLQPTSATLAGANGRVVLQLAPTIRKSTSTFSMQNR